MVFYFYGPFLKYIFVVFFVCLNVCLCMCVCHMRTSVCGHVPAVSLWHRTLTAAALPVLCLACFQQLREMVQK